MRVLVLGGDGYLGWPTSMYLSSQGHEVAIVDNMIKRQWEAEVGVEPLIPISSLCTRIRAWKEVSGKCISSFACDIAQNSHLFYKIVGDFKPNAVVHFAEQPSAPFSMISRNNCLSTQVNNISGTLNLMFAIQGLDPSIHIVKLGTMGEYGTPNIDIEEGWLDVEHNGRKDRVLFPKRPPSFYHLSKVHDSANLEFGCRSWNLRVTDLNQGIVYGVNTNQTIQDTRLATSFHYDHIFGTVLNRFIVQAVSGIPLTIYGNGGQTRGMLNIVDTLRCIELALNNPPENGEFRVFNQFTETFSVSGLAQMVQSVGRQLGLSVEMQYMDNFRNEATDHYFNAKHTKLETLGLNPTLLTDEVMRQMFRTVQSYAQNIDINSIHPTISWSHKRAK